MQNERNKLILTFEYAALHPPKFAIFIVGFRLYTYDKIPGADPFSSFSSSLYKQKMKQKTISATDFFAPLVIGSKSRGWGG